MSIAVRNEAMINFVKVVGGTAAVLMVAKAFMPNSVEKDPRSSDFGKIRVGDTRFDVTGGAGSIITLAMRLATLSSKSSTTGQINSLNSGEYGAQTEVDVFVNAAENKLSPLASVIVDLMLGKDFQGNKPTLAGETNNLFTPLPITTFEELSANPNSANIIIAMLADMLGINTNTYSITTNWDAATSKELIAFRTKVGDAKFKEANNKYNQTYATWFANIKNNAQYQKLSDEDKKKVITAKKTTIKDKVLQQYGFTYKPVKSKPVPKF